MSTDILLAPVGEGEQLPGGCWDFNLTDGGSWWVSPSNAAIPDLGTKDWVALAHFRYSIGTGTDYLWGIHKDAQNFLTLRRAVGNMEFLWRIGNVTTTCTVAIGDVGSHDTVLIWRNGDTLGLATLNGLVAPASQLVSNTQTRAGNDTFTASIKQDAASTLAIGRMAAGWTGQWFGSIGLVAWAIVPSGQSLTTNYLLDDNTKRHLLMRDPQRLFSYHGFSASDVTAFGNWQDSSGNPKSTLAPVGFASGDRNACPFTGNYLEIQNIAVGDTAHLAYTLPGHTKPMIFGVGGGPPLTRPKVLELSNPRRWITSRVQPNESSNGEFSIEFIGPKGEIDRWPVPVPFQYVFVDSSEANAKGQQFRITGTTQVGDTHKDMSLLLTPQGLVCSPYNHSNIISNQPASGDTLFSGHHHWLITDDALPALKENYTAWPWGSAYSGQSAYTEGTKTYSIWAAQPSQNRAIELAGSRSALARSAVVTQYDYDTDGWTWKKVVGENGADQRTYPQVVMPLSDGRVLLIGYCRQDGGGTRAVGNWGVIAPVKANWNDNTKWYAFDGTALDGASGRPLLGTVKPADLTLQMHTENTEYFPASFPADGAGLDAIPHNWFAYVSGGWEGVAAIVRFSVDNGNNARVTTNSSGGSNLPWDATYLRRWTYEASNNRFVLRDSFDITSLINSKSEAGTWPQDTNYNTAAVQWLYAQQPAANQLLLFLTDPRGVAIPTNISQRSATSGYRVRAILFHDLSLGDPRAYSELSPVLLDLPTDNSQGRGTHPFVVGATGEYAKSVAFPIATGEWHDMGGGTGTGGVKWKCVDFSRRVDSARGAALAGSAARFSSLLEGI